MFTGDQLGAIFAGRILAQYQASGKPLGRSWPMLVVVSVSSGHKTTQKSSLWWHPP